MGGHLEFKFEDDSKRTQEDHESLIAMLFCPIAKQHEEEYSSEGKPLQP